MDLIEKWKKRDSIKLSDLLFNSIIKKFEVLAGREFSSKVISSSSYNAIKNFLNGEKDGDIEEFLKDVLNITVGGSVIKFDMSKESGGVVQVKNSIEAKIHGPAESGVCYICSGIIKAAAEKILGRVVEVKERKCTAMGNELCEFAIIIS